MPNENSIAQFSGQSIQLPRDMGERHLSLENIAEKIGINLAQIKPKSIIRKLHLLNEKTEIFRDAVRAIELFSFLQNYYNRKMPGRAFTPEEERSVSAGTLFSDIGKTGPGNASPELSACITDIYKIEDIIKPTILLKDFLGEFFPKDANRRAQLLETNGINPEMTMREFYNLHAGWTLEIIKGSNISAKVIVAAATHHLLKGINPENIVRDDDSIAPEFGPGLKFGRAEKLVTLLDQYDASRRRGGKNHAEAIAYLQKAVGDSPRFRNDQEFKELISEMNTALRPNGFYSH